MHPALVPALSLVLSTASFEDAQLFEPLDVFGLETASDPRFSPDGDWIVFVRSSMDVMADRQRSNLWIVRPDGSDLRPLTTGDAGDSSPRWSPDGKRLLYRSSASGSSELWCRWMDTGQTAALTRTTETPSNCEWSPDGRWIAFTMHVPAERESFATMPAKPEGAQWAEPAIVIDSVSYRRDGSGYVEAGHDHLFVIPAEGGTPRRLTDGPFDVEGSPAWMPDGASLLFSSNRSERAEYQPLESELWRVTVADGSLERLTDRAGPDHGPRVSSTGRIAYLGHDDRRMASHQTVAYVMQDDGSGRALTDSLDRGVEQLEWAPDGAALHVSYTDHGVTRIARLGLDGSLRTIAEDLGGTSLGRPYGGGSFSVSPRGLVAFTHTTPHRPADIAVARPDGEVVFATRLNEDLLAHKSLGEVEEFTVASAHDELPVQGWIVKPPGFDPARKYPLILEIHGGPHADYGPRFSAECQLYAAAGHVVVYTNPRGSTSYGDAFANEIHHDYPNHDYDDLMSCVDEVVSRGYVDPERLFVTGGSGGGVLTAWIVGHTERFRAAVVAKPVINWYSFVLTADAYPYFGRYWFPGLPWDHLEHYMARSPISYVGNVTTPTMLLTGEEDYRTPMSETEQFYQALKLREVETAMVRIPGASHGITARPSNLIAKVVHVLAWFEKFDVEEEEPEAPDGE